MRGARALVALVGLLAGLGAPCVGAAHGRSTSYSSWSLDATGATVRVRIPLVELTRVPELAAAAARRDPLLADHLAERLLLSTPSAPCTLRDGPRVLAAPGGWWSSEWRLECAAGEPRTLESRILQPEAPSHLHFARVREADGSVRERVLSDRQPTWALDAPDTAPHAAGEATVAGYVRLGVEHIASGADHLAFLLALLLLAGSVAEVATLVTGFTIAHSVTLALAALGILHPDVTAVEALIGFSVALVAAEDSWLVGGRRPWLPWALAACLALLACAAALGVGALSALTWLGVAIFTLCHFQLLARASRPARLRVAIAFAFGLVHGFGFAGVLDELALPRARLLPALFGFNVGVELGQLTVVALAWPLLRQLARSRVGPLVTEVGSAAVCGLGVFWFATRAFGT